MNNTNINFGAFLNTLIFLKRYTKLHAKTNLNKKLFLLKTLNRKLRISYTKSTQFKSKIKKSHQYIYKRSKSIFNVLHKIFI